MKFTKYLFALTLSLSPVFTFAKQYNILDFGAVSDTSILSTIAVQRAIDECSTQGGGQVLVPAGLFKIGTIILKSNVNIHLESGAILYGSQDLKDYLQLKPEYRSLRTQEATIQLIYAEKVKNVSITGLGEINGQGSVFKKLSWNDEGITRPHLMRFITCSDVTIEGITLRNSGCWMQHYLACDRLKITGIHVFNRNNFNNDALDIDGCRNVIVSDLISDSDDDGITLKSTSPRLCENIVVSNCVISSRCNAIKLGTETNGGFKNICISNCVVKPSEIANPTFYGKEKGQAGVALEIVDGGIMEGISISNIQIDGTTSPLFIRLGNRARPYQKDIPVENIGNIRDINISNIQARNASNIGCSITGLPGHPVSNVRFNNIFISFAGGGTSTDAHATVEEKPKEYPESTMFGTLPAYGFYIRHANNLSFNNIQLSTEKEDLRPAFYIEDAQQSFFQSMQLSVSSKAEASIIMKSCRDINISRNKNTGPKILLDGKDNSNIYEHNQ
jgi:polygalacturonase